MASSGKVRVFSADSVEDIAIESGNGVTKAMLLGPETTPNFMMRRFTIQPGGAIPNHTNSVEHEQYVLGGAARVGIGDEVYDARPGDVLFIPPGAPHWYEAIGDEPYVFLCLGPNGEDRIELVEEA